MARKSKRRSSSRAAEAGAGSRSNRDKAIASLMSLLAEHPFEQIGLSQIAVRREAVARRAARRIRLHAVDPRRPHQGDRPRGAGRHRCRHGGGIAARAAVRRADAAARDPRAAQGGGALAAALGVAQSRPRAGAQRAGGALAAMDADRRRHRRIRARRACCARRAWRCCSPTCCAPGSTTTMTATPGRSPRSTASWRAASALPGCSTTCASCRSGPAP